MSETVVQIVCGYSSRRLRKSVDDACPKKNSLERLGKLKYGRRDVLYEAGRSV